MVEDCFMLFYVLQCMVAGVYFLKGKRSVYEIRGSWSSKKAVELLW